MSSTDSSPRALYEAALQAGELLPDAAQDEAVGRLDQLAKQLGQRANAGEAWWGRVVGRLRPTPPVRGLYIWGGVGRGKTRLMDLFHASLPFAEKRRAHFHRFMQSVHTELTDLRDQADPLAIAALRWSKQARVLCLDECFVQDIGDAMILARLLEELFSRGVTLITTSNVPPSDLYRDGLQRAKFLPAIALIEQHCEIHELVTVQDYRLRALTQAALWHSPLVEASELAMSKAFQSLVGAPAKPGQWSIHGRALPFKGRGNGVIWTDFASLCEQPRGATDYIELARCHHSLLLSGVPRLDAERDDAARRLVVLIDEIYDRSVKLVAAAEHQVLDLYRGERLQFEFQRTASRLIEMQSRDYLQLPHRP